MELITASVATPKHPPDAQRLADELTERLMKLPTVEHVRTRITTGIEIAVFVTAQTPEELAASEASIQAEISSG